MSTADWIKAGVDLLQAIISGITVALVIFWLDERRAKRERRISDYRIAANWGTTESKVSLRNFDLTKVNLSGYNFINANLEDTRFDDAELWGTKFSKANLRKASFRRARLLGTQFRNAIGYLADFSNSKIEKRKYPDRHVFVDFTEAELHRASFRGAHISGAVFASSKLVRVDFTNAVLLDCDFTCSDLTDSNWKKVKRVENCIWTNVIVDSQENFPQFLWNEIQKQNVKPKKRRVVK